MICSCSSQKHKSVLIQNELNQLKSLCRFSDLELRDIRVRFYKLTVHANYMTI